MNDKSHQNKNDEPNMQSIYARIGYFLAASSFLVAAFITLVISKKSFDISFIHSVAFLGSFVAGIYTVMNLWASLHPETNKEKQLLHTWLLPGAFFAFWVFTWYKATNINYVFFIILLLPLSYLYQKLRRNV
jgi:hypothetical protein